MTREEARKAVAAIVDDKYGAEIAWGDRSNDLKFVDKMIDDIVDLIAPNKQKGATE